jgi:hypothetical protein
VLIRVGRLVERRVQAALRDCGLTAAHYLALAHLLASPDCSRSELARGLQVTPLLAQLPSISSKILMPLAGRSRVDETGGASPADVVPAWRGLSPSQRLTLEPVPVGYSGLPPFRARVSDS